MENKELKQSYIDERTGIEYNLVNGYYIPNIVLPKPRRTGNVGKYGRMRARYLKEHKKAEYTILLIDGKLDEHLYNEVLKMEELKLYDIDSTELNELIDS